MGELTGSKVLVTGGSSGIGRGIVERFSAEGAEVGINCPPAETETASNVVETIEEEGGTASDFVADVSDADAVRSMATEVEERFGAIDVLVNNAGILTTSPLAEMSIETWDEMIGVNLRGVFLTTRFLLPRLFESDGGKIINVASQLGFVGKANLVHYCASKGGIIAFTRALARELAPEITVNAIAPGPIDTSISDTTQEERRRTEESLPMKRIGKVEDVVPTALFLASSDSDYYTGQTLSPDGGDAMH